jgi:hypothetical protein
MSGARACMIVSSFSCNPERFNAADSLAIGCIDLLGATLLSINWPKKFVF